jgi:hypothetical protein
MYTNSNDLNHQGGMIIKAGVETGEVVKKFWYLTTTYFGNWGWVSRRSKNTSANGGGKECSSGKYHFDDWGEDRGKDKKWHEDVK